MHVACRIGYLKCSINKKTIMCFYTKVNNNVLLSNNDVILECQICPQRIVIRSSSKKIDNFEDQVRYEKRALEKRVRLPNV